MVWRIAPAPTPVPALATAVLLLVLSACSGEGTPGAEAADATAGSAEITLSQEARAGKAIFERSCFACHTVGEGPGIGPDLKGVTERRDGAWLVRWIQDPIGMAQTDSLGKALWEEWNQVYMAPAGLSDDEIAQVLAYVEEVSGGAAAGAPAVTVDVPDALSEAQFARAGDIYFDRCAGCHGTLRVGATGPDIQPERTRGIGSRALAATLTYGMPGGMPAWGESGILSEEEVGLMARFVQMDPPEPPQRPLEAVRESWTVAVPVADRPTRPETDRDWENYFGVILRDAGKVGILDGDTKELVGLIDTGFAVHILRSSSTGRYFYAVGRDGRISLIDLWPETPTLVAQAQGCVDARSVDGSKFAGYEDRYLIEGCYWPPQYVVFDGLTLEPLAMTRVDGAAFDTGEPLEEVRVAAMVASHDDPVWVMGLKESGHVGIVDYSKPGFPMVAKIPAERFLHDGGWDHTGRYFLIAANMRDKMAVVDVQEQELVTTFQTGIKPHPGRGANWIDPEYGWVNGTTHIGEPLLAVYGADPEGSPEHAWEVVRRVPLESAGGLFLKTHPESRWVWMDMPMSNDPAMTRRICVYSKAEGEMEKCWDATDHGAIVHFEYDRTGREVWVSVWDKEGELIVYDDATLTEKRRITGDWLVTPTGKFNVHNSAHDIY